MNAKELREHLDLAHLGISVAEVDEAADWDALQALHAEAHRAHAAAQLAAGRDEA